MSEYLIDDELAEQDLLACAARVAETIDNLEGHAEAIANVAARYADAGQFDFAAALAETIDDPFSRDRTLSNIAVKATGAGESDYASQLLEAVEDPSFQAEALAQIAVTRAEAGDCEEAARVALGMEDASSTLAEIAVKCAAAGQYERALEIIQSIEYEGSAAYALTEIAALHIKSGRANEAAESLSRALAQAESIELAEDRVNMLVTVGLRYAEAGEQDRAESILLDAARLAETVEIEGYRESSYAQTSIGLARLGLDERSLEVASRIEDSFQAASAHTAIAAEHLRAGRREEALGLLSSALQLVTGEEFYNESGYPASKHRALAEIAVQYALASSHDEAVRTAKMIDAERDGNVALAEVTRASTHAGNTDQALQAARMIEISSLRVLAFTAIAGALLKDGQEQREQQGQPERALAVLSEAARAAEEIEWANDRTLALVEVALKYYEAEREAEVARILLQALESTREIENKLDLSAALARLSDAYHETGVETDDRVTEILREIDFKLD